MAKKPASERALPKSAAACGDLLYQTRQERLEAQKVVDDLAALETRLKDHLINTLPKDKASGISGKIARVQLEPEDIPIVEDWDKFRAYMVRTKAWDMLQKRINPKAVMDRRNAGKKVAGTGTFKNIKVSCTKIR